MESLGGIEDGDDLVAEFEAIEEDVSENAGVEDEVQLGEIEDVSPEAASNIDEDESWGQFEDYAGYATYEEDEFWGEDGVREEENWDAGEERIEELEREEQFETLAIPRELIREYELPGLPEGVVIVGEVARSVARQMVAGEAEPVRDLRLMYIPELSTAENALDAEELDELSKEYMPDEYINGRNMPTKGLEEYFLTRDFTVDQCLIDQDQLVLTRAAYDDLQENVIRPSYGTQPNIETPIGEQVFLRALLAKAVLMVATDTFPTLEEFGLKWIEKKMEEHEGSVDGIRMRAFEVATMMNEAMGRGAEVAQKFLEEMVEYGVIDEYYKGRPLLLARKARDRCDGFTYRPDGDWTDETGYDEFEEEVIRLADKQQTHSTKARKVRQEYESYFRIKERETGEYSAEEYAWANGS